VNTARVAVLLLLFLGIVAVLDPLHTPTDPGSVAMYRGFLILGVVGLFVVFHAPRRSALWLGRRAWKRFRRTRPLIVDELAIMHLTTDAFEHFCGRLMEGEGYHAEVTRRSGDFGVDVKLRDRAGRVGFVQCKHAPTATIGRDVVQKLVGAMHGSASFGYLITTGHFTTEAAEWARSRPITLVDREALLRMIDAQARR
jgi:restriction system protein